jgi:hypothetical protein
MAWNRDLARRNVDATIKRTEAILAEPASPNPIFPGARASLARDLAEAREARDALDNGERVEGWD